jgi:uncharacterized protein YjlB
MSRSSSNNVSAVMGVLGGIEANSRRDAANRSNEERSIIANIPVGDPITGARDPWISVT